MRQALEEAWSASQPNDPANRHEEGGWIYLDLISGEVSIRPAPRGTQAEIILDAPPEISGSVIVGITTRIQTPLRRDGIQAPAKRTVARTSETVFPI